MRDQLRVVALWLCGLVACGATAQPDAGHGGTALQVGTPPEHVALTGGHIIPVVGAPIEKGTVLIERGKISAIGEKVEVPVGACRTVFLVGDNDDSEKREFFALGRVIGSPA